MSTHPCYSCGLDESAAGAVRKRRIPDPFAMKSQPNEQGERPAPSPLEADEPSDAPTIAADGFAPMPCDGAEATTAKLGWPWARLARPAVIEVGERLIDASGVAAIDYAVAAARDAAAEAVGVPVSLALLPEGDAGACSPQGYGVAFSADATEALVMLDPQAVRLLSNGLAVSAGAAPSPGPPGPIAEAGEVDRGLMEYLTVAVLDRVLRSAGRQTHAPIIRAFCDPAGATVWLQRQQARAYSFAIALGGSTGIVRLYLTGLSDPHAAALQGCLATLDTSGSPAPTVAVGLALPPVALQSQEMASMQPGDVLLLGAPSLLQMPVPCELVTDTHWTLGHATITHDTPTWLNVDFTPGTASPNAAALAAPGSHVVRPVLGHATIEIERVARWTGPRQLPLSKSPVAPVTLFHGVRRIGQGELIILGSELGVRLTEAPAKP